MQRQSLILTCIVAVCLENVSESSGAEPQTFLQPDISAAKIVETKGGYTVDVSLVYQCPTSDVVYGAREAMSH